MYHIMALAAIQLAFVASVTAQCVGCGSPSSSFPSALKIVIPLVAVAIVIAIITTIYFRYRSSRRADRLVTEVGRLQGGGLPMYQPNTQSHQGFSHHHHGHHGHHFHHHNDLTNMNNTQQATFAATNPAMGGAF